MTNIEVFRGSDCSITLSAGNPGPSGGLASDLIDTFQANPVGRATHVEVRVDTALQEFHEIGKRHAQSLRPGRISVSGRMQRAYINGFLLRSLMGDGAQPERPAEPYAQPTFNLHLRLENPAVEGKASNVTVYGVMLENWAFDLPEDDFVMESVAFRALSISVHDTEG